MFGINIAYLLLQGIPFALWLLISALVLLELRRRPNLPGAAVAIWAVFIVVVPFLGALAFLLVQPGRARDELKRV